MKVLLGKSDDGRAIVAELTHKSAEPVIDNLYAYKTRNDKVVFLTDDQFETGKVDSSTIEWEALPTS